MEDFQLLKDEDEAKDVMKECLTGDWFGGWEDKEDFGSY